jgi:hypothetical protein
VRKPSEQAGLFGGVDCCGLDWSYCGTCSAWMGAGVTVTMGVTTHTLGASPDGWHGSVLMKKRHDLIE